MTATPTPSGRIVRLDILQRLIDRFGYRDYLEIGVAGGGTFKHIRVAHKTGVDPTWRLWYMLRRDVRKVTSDRFFEQNRQRNGRRTFDLIFVDGLHIAEQAYRDVENALEVLNPGGSILCHDCLPTSRAQQEVPRIQVSWTGNVWRSFLRMSQREDLHTLVFDTDRGCGLIRREPRPPGHAPAPAELRPMDASLEWETFDAHKHELLRIVPKDQVFDVIDSLGRESEEG